MIILLIDAKVSAANRKGFLNAARAQAEASRAEKGCLAFDVLEDPLEAGSIRFVELWKTADALEQHREQAHSKQFRKSGRPLADSLKARKFNAKELD
jgi:autoinducer 2-degrading protein